MPLDSPGKRYPPPWAVTSGVINWHWANFGFCSCCERCSIPTMEEFGAGRNRNLLEEQKFQIVCQLVSRAVRDGPRGAGKGFLGLREAWMPNESPQGWVHGVSRNPLPAPRGPQPPKQKRIDPTLPPTRPKNRRFLFHGRLHGPPLVLAHEEPDLEPAFVAEGTTFAGQPVAMEQFFDGRERIR